MIDFDISKSRKNILIIDSQRLFLEALSLLLKTNLPNSTIISTFRGIQAVEMLAAKEIDLVIIDLNTVDMHYEAILKRIDTDCTRVVVLTNFKGTAIIRHLIAEGIDGLIHKDDDVGVLFECINVVLHGGMYYNQFVRKAIFESLNSDQEIPSVSLSKRGCQIVQLMRKGKTSQEIANILKLTKGTINSYKENLLRCTQTKNSNELVAFFMENGILR